MFILSYFRKKQTIKVKENTLEHLDDDFIVISDTLNNISIEEDKKEENVKNIDIVDQLKINNNSIEYVNEENNEVNYDTSYSASRLWRDEENQLIENTKDNHKKLSFCDKIMNTLSIVYQIFNEKMERTYHK
jgi:hypothetical protein